MLPLWLRMRGCCAAVRVVPPPSVLDALAAYQSSVVWLALVPKSLLWLPVNSTMSRPSSGNRSKWACLAQKAPVFHRRLYEAGWAEGDFIAGMEEISGVGVG